MQTNVIRVGVNEIKTKESLSWNWERKAQTNEQGYDGSRANHKNEPKTKLEGKLSQTVQGRTWKESIRVCLKYETSAKDFHRDHKTLWKWYRETQQKTIKGIGKAPRVSKDYCQSIIKTEHSFKRK